MDIVVVTPHTDDFIYGTAGTLLTHARDKKHIVAVCGVQKTGAREVAAGVGATIEFLDAPYHRISEQAERVKNALADIFQKRKPTYIFAPPDKGDWTADHTTVGRAVLDAANLAGVFGWPSRVLRFPIASTTLDFHPNVWINLPTSVVPEEGRAGGDHDPRSRGRVAARPGRMGGQPGASLLARRGLAVQARRGIRRGVRGSVPPAATARGSAG